MNYKTYAEAKIANPDSQIVTTGENWKWAKNSIGAFLPCNESIKESEHKDGWVICNPADYCSSLKDYFDAGFKLVAGDKIIGVDNSVFDIAEYTEFNEPDEEDCERYILSAAALNGGRKIPAKAEQWTVYNNTMPLCELTDEQAGMLFNAWRKGVEIENCLYDEKHEEFVWVNCFSVLSNIEGIYRIKTKSERELFVEAACKAVESNEHYNRMNINIDCSAAMRFTVEAMYDSGDFEYKDLTQHFGENI